MDSGEVSHTSGVHLAVVAPGSAHLAEVRRLWRAESATLGFFPEGAFEEHARLGRVLAAVEPNDAVAGYLIYRFARGLAVVVHLCVARGRRGGGLAQRLFTAFRNRTADARGALVTCRADFAATALWPRLGFHRVGEEAARERGKTLLKWWLDYGHPDLFSSTATGTPLAVLDANVAFDLQDGARARNQESRALDADWLRGAFTLAVTPELFEEIARAGSGAERGRRRHFASSLHCITAREEDVDATLREIGAVLGPPATESDRSDQRHLAYGVLGGATYFVTRDGNLLAHAGEIEARLQLRVLRPADLVSEHDAAERPALYEPERLDGAAVTVRAVRASDVGALDVFRNRRRGETKAGLPRVLREALADPRTTDLARVVLDADGGLAALVASGAREAGAAGRQITLLRARPSRVGLVLVHHLLWKAVVDALARGDAVLEFADAYADETVEHALAAVGFVRAGERWMKVLVRGVRTYEGAQAELMRVAEAYALPRPLVAVLADALGRGWAPERAAEASLLERTLWPLKLRDAALPSFLVPIQPRWAEALFDVHMASESLFAADPEVLLRLEHAYYRSSRPRTLRDPGRVLWYVSGGHGYSHAGCMCAASALTEVAVRPAGAIFSRFRRFGVFTQQDVEATAGGPTRDVMAFSFSHTEMLPAPLPFRALRDALVQRRGRAPTLQSPLKLAPDHWLELYEAAMGPATVAAGAPA